MKRRPTPAREYIEGPEAIQRFETLAKRMLTTPLIRPRAYSLNWGSTKQFFRRPGT
jgi:hypothetical protein